MHEGRNVLVDDYLSAQVANSPGLTPLGRELPNEGQGAGSELPVHL